MQGVFAWHILFKDFLSLDSCSGKTAMARATDNRTDEQRSAAYGRLLTKLRESVEIETTSAVINKAVPRRQNRHLSTQGYRSA